MVRIKPSKEELEQLYCIKKMPVNQIAKIFNVANDTVKSWIIYYNLKYRGIGSRKLPKDFVKPDKETLNKMYNNEKLTLREIGNIFGVGKTTVRRWFNRYGLNIRSNPSDSRLAKKSVILPTKVQLIEDYKILSIELIAKKYNVSTEPILTLLNKYQIKKRSRSESRQLALETKRSISWNKGLTKDDPKVAKMVQHLHEKHMEKIDEANVKQAITKKKLMDEGKLSVWNKGKKLSPEHRKKLSDAKKKLDSPEYRDRMREIGLKAKPKSGLTKPEKLMKTLLEKEGLTDGLVSQYPLKIGNFATKPDFAYPKHKIAIYCDGEYWHGGLHHLGKTFENMKDGRRKENIKNTRKKDANQHFVLWSNGWISLRFWQHQIEENPDWVIEQIKKNMFDEDYIKERERQRKEYLEMTTKKLKSQYN